MDDGRPNEIGATNHASIGPNATLRGLLPRFNQVYHDAACPPHVGSRGKKVVITCLDLRTRIGHFCARGWANAPFALIDAKKISEVIELQSLRRFPRGVVSFHSINQSRFAGAPSKKRTGEIRPDPRSATGRYLKSYKKQAMGSGRHYDIGNRSSRLAGSRYLYPFAPLTLQSVARTSSTLSVNSLVISKIDPWTMLPRSTALKYASAKSS